VEAHDNNLCIDEKLSCDELIEAVRGFDLASQVIWLVIIAMVAIPFLVVHKIDTDIGTAREDWTLAACGSIAVVNILVLILQFMGSSTMVHRLVPILAMEFWQWSNSTRATHRPDFLPFSSKCIFHFQPREPG
jgi:hypothetical protein